MFGIFKKPQDDERTRAIAVWEKAVSVTTETHESRSLRLRMGMLVRAHLDKTFVAGAQLTEAHERACAQALQQGKAKPEPPTAPLFQKLKSSSGEVLVYLPKEYAQEMFAIGGLYQKTDLSAEQALAAAQRLADRIAYDALHLTSPIVALQFLRDELAAAAGAGEGDAAGEGGEPGDAAPPGAGG